MYNILASDNTSPLAMARILSLFILDQYLATVETRKSLPLLDESTVRLLTRQEAEVKRNDTKPDVPP
jgi:hypothetical protein